MPIGAGRKTAQVISTMIGSMYGTRRSSDVSTITAISVNPTIMPIPRSAPIFHAVDSEVSTSEWRARDRSQSQVSSDPAVVSTL